MSWCIDDIDFCILVIYSSILRKDSDTSLTLNIIRVHYTFLNFLIGTEYTALFLQLVYQSCFTMVYVGDNGNVSYIFSFCLHSDYLPFIYTNLYVSATIL